MKTPLTRRQFCSGLAGGLVLLALGGWRWGRRLALVCVTRAAPGRYPGPVRPLDEAAARARARWAG